MSYRGLLRCDHCGTSLGISFVKKPGNKLYRYYVCVRAAKNGYDTCPVRSLPATSAVAAEDPAMKEAVPTEAEVLEALVNIVPVWDALFPREEERIVKLLVEKVAVSTDALEVTVRTGGLQALVAELRETTSGAENRKVSQ